MASTTTSNQEVLSIEASSRPKPYDIAGFNISPLATKEQTQGHEIFHQDGTKGKGPGQHFHPWDESFFVTKGTVHYGTKKQDDIVEDNTTLERIAHVGDFVHIPANTVSVLMLKSRITLVSHHIIMFILINCIIHMIGSLVLFW